MDRLLLASKKLKTTDAIPMILDGRPMMALRLINFMDEEEIIKLKEYANMVFADTDDNRRKKVARLKNTKAAKKICKRFKFKKFKLGDSLYEIDSYMEDVEIIRWVRNKSLCDISQDKLWGAKYSGDEKTQYVTYVVSLDGPGAHTTLVAHDGETDVIIQSRISLMFHNGSVSLKEVMFREDRTHLFFHIKYRLHNPI